MRTVIFDLDGTLADTSGDLIAAANACFRALGAGDVLDPARDQATAFAGGRAMLRLGFRRLGQTDAVLVEREFPLFIEYYARAIDCETLLYPGAIGAVEALRAQGYRVGICTNKPEALAEDLLARLGVRGLFDALVGADTLAVRKPAAEPFFEAVRRAGGNPARSMLVGDTVTDRETARAAGVPCLLVTFGPAGDEVQRMAPEGFLDSYDRLVQAVQGLIG